MTTMREAMLGEAKTKTKSPVDAAFYKYFDRIQVPLFDLPKISKDIEMVLADVEDSEGDVDLDTEMQKLVKKWSR